MPSPWSLLAVAAATLAVLAARPALGSSQTERLFADLGMQTLLLGLAPVVWKKIFARATPVALGLVWPHGKRDRLEVLVLASLAVPVALALSRVPALHAAYPQLEAARMHPWWLIPSTVAFAVYGLAWEGFFRGFLLFGLRPHLGRLAIVAQAIPCGLLHAGKPGIEFALSFPFAVALGGLAWRWRSFLPGALLHLWLAFLLNVACVAWPG